MVIALPSRRVRFPFVARIVLAMTLGVVVGSAFGNDVAWLGELGAVIINLIKSLAGPLLFFAVVDAFMRTQVQARSAAVMVAISLTNALIAVCVGLTISNVLRPGDHFPIDRTDVSVATTAQAIGPVREINILRELERYLPKNIVQPFLDNSVITIVILAVLVGGALRTVKTEQSRHGSSAFRAVEDFVATVFRTIEVMLGWV